MAAAREQYQVMVDLGQAQMTRMTWRAMLSPTCPPQAPLHTQAGQHLPLAHAWWGRGLSAVWQTLQPYNCVSSGSQSGSAGTVWESKPHQGTP